MSTFADKAAEAGFLVGYDANGNPYVAPQFPVYEYDQYGQSLGWTGDRTLAVEDSVIVQDGSGGSSGAFVLALLAAAVVFS